MEQPMEEKKVDSHIPERLERLIGETVIIFTASGGMSGSGFTGVLLEVNPCFVRIMIKISAAPACPLGNGCRPIMKQRGFFSVSYVGEEENYLGAIADIPINRIVSFIYNEV